MSYAVEVDAPDAATAELLGLDQMPGENMQDADTAGDWECLSITDKHQHEYVTGGDTPMSIKDEYQRRAQSLPAPPVMTPEQRAANQRAIRERNQREQRKG